MVKPRISLILKNNLKFKNQFLFSATKDDDNSLALRSANGTYLVNGNKIITNYERIVFYENAKIEYSGTGVLKDSEIELTTEIDQNKSIDVELARLSNYERKLTQEYNLKLDKLRFNKIPYSTDYINRLYKHQTIIKQYRQKIQMLSKDKLRNTFQKRAIKEANAPFTESIVIRQKLKDDLIVEVLSVGELQSPKIVYKYSIGQILNDNKLKDLELANLKNSLNDLDNKVGKRKEFKKELD